MFTRSTPRTIAPGVEKIVQEVRKELWSFFRHDSHHSPEGRLAHVYFEPAIRGNSAYERRELLSIEAMPYVRRIKAHNRGSSDLSPPEQAHENLDSTQLKVDIGLRNPHNLTYGHCQVNSVGDAFSEFLNCCSFMLEQASDSNEQPGQAEQAKPAMSVTMILSTSAGPLAILVGDSDTGTLIEDRPALMQARILNARR